MESDILHCYNLRFDFILKQDEIIKRIKQKTLSPMKHELKIIHQKLDLILEFLENKTSQQPPLAQEQTLNIKEAAKKLQLSVSRIYALIYAGKLQPLQNGRYSRILFTEEILNQYHYGNNTKSNINTK